MQKKNPPQKKRFFINVECYMSELHTIKTNFSFKKQIAVLTIYSTVSSYKIFIYLQKVYF